jgi:hypothetical protein
MRGALRPVGRGHRVFQVERIFSARGQRLAVPGRVAERTKRAAREVMREVAVASVITSSNMPTSAIAPIAMNHSQLYRLAWRLREPGAMPGGEFFAAQRC